MADSIGPNQVQAGFTGAPSKQVPRYQQQVEPQAVRMTATPVNNDIGRGLEQLGDTVGKIADVQARAQQKIDEAQQQMWLSQASSAAELKAQEMMDAAQKSTPGGQPIRPTLDSDWQKFVTQQTGALKATPELQAQLAEHLDRVGVSMQKNALSYDTEEQQRYAYENFQDTTENKQKLIQTLPYDQVVPRAKSDVGELTSILNKAPMKPEDRAKWKDYVTQNIPDAAMNAQISQDPEKFLLEHSIARRPDVRASDPNLPRGIRNNNPGNLTGSDAWQGKTGADDKGFAQFDTPEAGLRAMAVNLKNQPDKHGLDTVEAIVSKYAPPNENDTAAYVRAVASDLGVKPDEKIDLNKPEMLAGLMHSMINHENGAQPYSQDSILWAAQTAINPDEQGPMPPPSRKDGGVDTGNEIFNLGSYKQQLTWITKAETAVREKGEINAAVTNYSNPDFLYDPGNADHKKGVDIVFQQAGGPAALQQMQPQGANTLMTIAQRTGILPPKAEGTIRSMMETGNDQQRGYAYDMIARLQEDAPAVLDQFKASDISKATLYDNYIRNGVDQRTALSYVNTQFNPLNKPVMEMRKDALPDFLKKTLGDDNSKLPPLFEGIFDPGIFTIGPSLPRNAAAADQAKATYQEALKDEFMMHGDADVAKTRAAEQVKRIYGESRVTGSRTIMMYPPEKYYAIPGVDNEWMQKQLLDDVHGMEDHKDVELKNLELLPDKVTAADISAGRLPRYQVMKEQDGIWDSLRAPDGNVLYYSFDQAKVMAELSAKQKAERQDLLMRAQIRRAAERTYSSIGPHGNPMELQ